MKKIVSTVLCLALILSSAAFSFAKDGKASYKDVPEGNKYFNAVEKVTEAGLFEGDGDIFMPNNGFNRAMMVTVLCRYVLGSEENYKPKAGFEYQGYTDVEEGTWYTETVMWATETGIIEGFGNGLYKPMENITREQFAKVLYYLEKSRGMEGENPGESDGFADSSAIADWAKDSMDWAVSSGILRADENGKLLPKQPMNRAEAALAFSRWISLSAE